jgi:thiamine-monophosphate kinase
MLESNVPTKPRTRAKEQQAGELALIERIRERAGGLAAGGLRLGIGDDCAVIRVPRGHEVLVTTDFSLEGRHFRRDWHSPESIGHRTLARGLSDIAAMGGRPLATFLSLALPKSVARDAPWVDSFWDGLLALAREHEVPLAGGDMAGSPLQGDAGFVLADIVVVGAALKGRALRRSGARSGDLLYCTGALGGAAAELKALADQKQRKRLRQATVSGEHPHLFPRPRLAAGRSLLRRKLATACIDLSDGLSTDLAHLCRASGVCAELDAALLPAHPLTAALPPAEQITAMLHGGEDYELLFTARAGTRVPARIAGVAVTRIGRVVTCRKARPLMTIVAEGSRFELKPQGWEHLR